MTQNKTDNKQTLKKYGVFAAMIAVFCISMWFIFKPSEADKEKEQQQMGLNADIPDPQNTGIIDNKITAYEQELMREKKEDRMRSLQDYSFGSKDKESTGNEVPSLESEADSLNDMATTAIGNSPRAGSRRQSSAVAFTDINETLDSFYEKKEDVEKEALKKEIEELKKAQETSGGEMKRPTVEDQVAIMEKSYELAAKYIGGGQQTQNEVVETTSKIQVSPVKQLQQHIVSSLSQPMTNEEFVEQFTKARNTGFYTSVGDESVINSDRNTISAVIHDTQKIKDGQVVNVRITEPMVVGSRIIPVNKILSGYGKISGERVLITITSIEQDGTIIPISLSAYDKSGQQGIRVPGSMEVNAVKEIAGNMGGSLGSSINISQQSAGDQLLGDLGRSTIQGTSQYIASKAKEVKVTLKAGHPLLLLISEQ